MYNETFPWEDFGKESNKVLTYSYTNTQLGFVTRGTDGNGSDSNALRLAGTALFYWRIGKIREALDGDINSSRVISFDVNLMADPNRNFLASHPSMFRIGVNPPDYGASTTVFAEKDFVAAEEEMMADYGCSRDEAMSRYFAQTVLRYGVEQKDIELFIKQQTGVTSYVYEIQDWRRTYIILRADDNFHKGRAYMKNTLASCLPRLLPWLFDDSITSKAMPLLEEEKAMLNALPSNDPATFQSKAEEILGGCQGKFRSLGELAAYAPFIGFSLRALNARQIEADRAFYNARDTLSVQRDRLKTAYEEFETRQIVLEEIKKEAGDTEKLNAKDMEIAEYFSSNKAITSVTTQGGTVRYGVFTPLKNFDPDIFDSYLENDCSLLYNCDYDSVGLSEGEAIRVLRAIFETEEVELMMNGCFDYRAKDHWRYKGADSSDGIQNPHLYHYNCFGDYGPELDYAVSTGDIIAFAENSIASVGSINLGEACTVENFIRDLFFEYPDADEGDEAYQELNESLRFRYDGDPTLHTLWGTLQYLKKKDEERANS